MHDTEIDDFLFFFAQFLDLSKEKVSYLGRDDDTNEKKIKK